MNFVINEKFERNIVRSSLKNGEDFGTAYDKYIREKTKRLLANKMSVQTCGKTIEELLENAQDIEAYYAEQAEYFYHFPLEFYKNIWEFLKDEELSDVTVGGFSIKAEYDKYADRYGKVDAFLAILSCLSYCYEIGDTGNISNTTASYFAFRGI